MAESNRKKLINYLKKNLAKGYTLDSLQLALIRQGYTRMIVERAIKDVTDELAKKAPILKEKPRIKYEIIDRENKPVIIKKSWLRRIFRG